MKSIQDANQLTAPPPTSPGGRLEIREIERTYPLKRSRRRGRSGEQGRERVALRPLSLTIEPGEFVALLGPNGSGKSTLLRILSSIEMPDRGSIVFDGLSPFGNCTDARVYRSQLGVAFQTPGLDPLLTVRENLRLSASLIGMSRAIGAACVEAMANRFEISDRLDDRVGTLSGGLARRVDLCRAVMGAPSLLLLDEATGGLDLRARESFLALVESLHRQSEMAPTIVMATHLMEEAERADRVMMMHEGRVVADGSPRTLREELGSAMCRVRPRDDGELEAARSILEACGVRVTESERGLVVPFPTDELGRGTLCARLGAAGVSFEVGSPTLGDAYLRATGHTLELSHVATGAGVGVGTPTKGRPA